MKQAIGYVPAWIEAKQQEPSLFARIKQQLAAMTAQRENGWGIMKIVVQLVLGVILTALAGSAAFTAKSLSNHESRISVVEEWKRERSAQLDRIQEDVARINTHNATADQQARGTDMMTREIAAQMRVMSDTLIRMQEGVAALREKMVSIQVATDEIKGTK